MHLQFLKGISRVGENEDDSDDNGEEGEEGEEGEDGECWEYDREEGDPDLFKRDSEDEDGFEDGED